MKFKFSLQKVLEHRKIQENLAQKVFQEAVAVHLQEFEKLQKMQNQITEAHALAGSRVQQGGNTGAALVQIHEFLKGQKVLIQNQEFRVQEAVKLVESKREILRQAALDYKIMERMREKKFEEYKSERLATEQKENDEQSILRYKVKES